MPNIIIREVDETVASLEGVSTDVVYVPGFAATNCNVYISNVSGKTPDSLRGTLAGESDNYNTPLSTNHPYPSFACNIADKIMWKYATVWEEQSTYIEPAPENVPTLCTTKEEFKQAFGALPYQWVNETYGDTTETDTSLKNRMQFPGTVDTPAWEANAFQTNVVYAYSKNDFEKSYIYAHELVSAGLPVIYDNIVEREEIGSTTFARKIPPYVNYLYTHLSEQLHDLSDTGEYTVKYITSGAYPTFEYIGGSDYSREYVDIISNYDFKGASGQVYIIPTPNCCGTKPDGTDIGGPSKAVITFTYKNNLNIVVQDNIEVNSGLPYVQTDKGYGGVGNKIECTADGIKITYASAYVWQQDSTYEASGTEITESGITPITMGITPTASSPHYYNSTDNVSWTSTLDASFNPSWNVISATVVATASVTITESPFDLTAKMISVAAGRGDAVAIIDHTNNPVRPLTGSASVYFSISKNPEHDYEEGAEFATMFTPWASYSLVSEDKDVPSIQVMPGSFAFTSALARSIRTNANWLAIAGVSRGLVPNIRSLNTVQRLTNTIANQYQPRDGIAINAITNIRPYGLTIWGNRTLKKNVKNLTATSLLSIRNLVSEVKKIAYTTAKSLMFEQNTEVLWDSFKTGIIPLLDQMMTGQGLTDYKIIRGVTTERAKIVAEIRLYPVDAVEDFEIRVSISDENVSVD